MKLGFFKPEAIAAGIVWFVIIVLVSPFFGYEYVRQDNYVTVQRYDIGNVTIGKPVIPAAFLLHKRKRRKKITI